MRNPALDPELLAPTLAPDYDVSRFRRPWRPESLVLVSFLGGFTAGGALFALNFQRMQKRERMLWTLGGTLVFAVFVILAGWPKHNPMVVRIPSVALAMLLAWMQGRDVHAYRAVPGCEPARAWAAGALAIVGAWLFHGSLLVALGGVLRLLEESP